MRISSNTELCRKLGSHRRIAGSRSKSRSRGIRYILKLIESMLIMFLYCRFKYTIPPSDLSTELSELITKECAGRGVGHRCIGRSTVQPYV